MLRKVFVVFVEPSLLVKMLERLRILHVEKLVRVLQRREIGFATLRLVTQLGDLVAQLFVLCLHLKEVIVKHWNLIL